MAIDFDFEGWIAEQKKKAPAWIGELIDSFLGQYKWILSLLGLDDKVAEVKSTVTNTAAETFNKNYGTFTTAIQNFDANTLLPAFKNTGISDADAKNIAASSLKPLIQTEMKNFAKEDIPALENGQPSRPTAAIQSTLTLRAAIIQTLAGDGASSIGSLPTAGMTQPKRLEQATLIADAITTGLHPAAGTEYDMITLLNNLPNNGIARILINAQMAKEDALTANDLKLTVESPLSPEVRQKADEAVTSSKTNPPPGTTTPPAPPKKTVSAPSP
jgi:hypothetical protein